MEIIKYKNSTARRIIALVALIGIIIYGFFLKDNLLQSQRILVAYSVITLAGIIILARGYYYTFSNKKNIITGRKAYLMGAAVILFGLVKILSLYNFL
jgi:hypothetical protein